MKRSYGARFDIYSGYTKVGYVKRSGSRRSIYESYSKIGYVDGASATDIYECARATVTRPSSCKARGTSRPQRPWNIACAENRTVGCLASGDSFPRQPATAGLRGEPELASPLQSYTVAFMGLWLFKFNQPGGFDAMRRETDGFTRVASHRRVSAEPGDRMVIYNSAGQHVAAVLEVTKPAYKLEQGEDLERWPYAVGTRPQLLSPRGPKWSVAGRNFRRLDEKEFSELQAVVRRNQA